MNQRIGIKMKVMVDLLGLVCGAIVGIALGCFAAIGLGYWSQITHPNDPSAGAVAIVVIFTAPFGAISGAVLGILAARKSETGIHLILKAVGYSETFGGTSYPWSRMSEEEVKALIDDNAMPPAEWEP